MKSNYFSLAIWSLFVVSPVLGQPVLPPATTSLFDHFYAEDHLIQEIIIKTDIKKLLKGRTEEHYQPAEITYYDPQGEVQTSQIKVRVRGVTRKRICEYPPLKLKFDKNELEAAGLKPFNKLKLVTQVSSAPKSEEYIFKEYLAYRLYNLLTPYSFRVQLIKITYKDSAAEKKDRTFYGLLLEPKEELAARINGQLYEPETCKRTFLEKVPYKTMAVFQYMIGNTDWAVHNLHNLKLVKVDSLPRLVPIPYDFDYAGIVNTHYAVPHESMPIKTVTERHYRGKAWTAIESEAVTATFLAQKEAMLSLCEQFPHLSKTHRKYLIGYLSSFFNTLEHPKRAHFVFGKR